MHSVVVDGAHHDPGDEDQAERKPRNWWLYAEMAGRARCQCCCVCGSLSDAVRHVTREQPRGPCSYETFQICSDPRCVLAIDAFTAAQRRRSAA